MDRFDNVTVVKKANSFFDGRVTSRTILFPDGTKKTLGIAQPGEYTFNTDSAEIMEIMSGEVEASIADGPWTRIPEGGSFQIPANSRFVMRVNSIVDYCCSFV